MPRIFPIYLFTGDDEYLKREAVEKLKKALLSKGSEAFNFSIFEAGSCNIKDVIQTLRSVPFASGKRLVLLTHADAAPKDTQDAILEYAGKPSEHACFVLESRKAEIPGNFAKEIKRHTREVSFLLPKGNRIAEWIRKEFRARGKTIDYNAAHLLQELKKDDIYGLRPEIDKLAAYAGKRHNISREDVEAIVASSASRNVFEFVHALSMKNAKDAFEIAKELSKTKKTIPEILGMIGWQFRRIKKAKELLKKGLSGRKASLKCNVPPFYMERFINEIKTFKTEELDRNMDYLLSADYSIKRGYAKPQDALEVLIVKICGKE